MGEIFNEINEKVFSPDMQFEDLQGICIGLAAQLDLLSSRLEKPVRNTSELLPCPFCGKIPHIDEKPSRRGVQGAYSIFHDSQTCPVAIKVNSRNTKDEAILAWNKRANTASE